MTCHANLFNFILSIKSQHKSNTADYSSQDVLLLRRPYPSYKASFASEKSADSRTVSAGYSNTNLTRMEAARAASSLQ